MHSYNFMYLIILALTLGIATFFLNDGELFNNDRVQAIEINNAAKADLVVINVAGQSIEFRQGNMGGSFLSSVEGRSRVVWNFYEAQKIDLGSKQFVGSLLAPFAEVTHQGNIRGTTVARSLDARAGIQLPNVVSVGVWCTSIYCL